MHVSAKGNIRFYMENSASFDSQMVLWLIFTYNMPSQSTKLNDCHMNVHSEKS